MPKVHRRGLSLLALAALALLLVPTPTGAHHPQTQNGATVTFDHDGDNEWWIEVLVKPGPGESIVTMEARAGDGGYHNLRNVAQIGEWTKWATDYPHGQFRIPPGELVQFRAGALTADTGDYVLVESCRWTHPAGVEQCEVPPPAEFDASFTGVRGNEWWVQANVASNGPTITRVDVTLDNGATYRPLNKQTWGPNAWAASYHITQGTIVQLRATASDGQTDFSSCYRWIPPSGQNAAIVDCPSGFDATFSGVRGNNWWKEVIVSGNQPIAGVYYTVNCNDNQRFPMQYQADWGKWIEGSGTATGVKIVFYAQATNPDSPTGFDTASSQGYIWPEATPTSGC